MVGKDKKKIDIRSAHESSMGVLEENERYRILIENTYDIVYSIDREGNLTYVSPQARRYGFDPDELMSQNFLNFVHPKDREAMLYSFQKTITEGSEFISQFRIKNKRG